jgi:hypothetical protein
VNAHAARAHEGHPEVKPESTEEAIVNETPPITRAARSDLARMAKRAGGFDQIQRLLGCGENRAT